MGTVIVDIGNSRTRAVSWTGAEEQQPGRLFEKAGAGVPTALPQLGEWPTPSAESGADLLLRELVALRRDSGAELLVLVSVVPRVDQLIRTALPASVCIDHTTGLPFAVGVEQPATVGADRYCNVAAACFAGLSDALIVDAGTATTFDILRAGEFIGGLIAPGMAFAAARLGESAARLEAVPFAPCPLDAGRDTAAAMSRGAYHVGRHGVLGTIAALHERYGDMPVVLTGGLGEMLGTDAGAYDRDWTLRGAALLATSR